jgi:hypothetical protein
MSIDHVHGTNARPFDLLGGGGVVDPLGTILLPRILQLCDVSRYGSWPERPDRRVMLLICTLRSYEGVVRNNLLCFLTNN